MQYTRIQQQYLSIEQLLLYTYYGCSLYKVIGTITQYGIPQRQYYFVQVIVNTNTKLDNPLLYNLRLLNKYLDVYNIVPNKGPTPDTQRVTFANKQTQNTLFWKGTGPTQLLNFKNEQGSKQFKFDPNRSTFNQQNTISKMIVLYSQKTIKSQSSSQVRKRCGFFNRILMSKKSNKISESDFKSQNRHSARLVTSPIQKSMGYLNPCYIALVLYRNLTTDTNITTIITNTTIHQKITQRQHSQICTNMHAYQMSTNTLTQLHVNKHATRTSQPQHSSFQAATY
eukprot:TRINITY_DN3940_c0_g1_i2.p1 TRINITY_DN3940_c0_g1~~TRINITY_DN3940_c0_g1_i2.p1  ORF type:complete len:283 (+),score=-23.61 TRINITY_DN3940_c0_g1_i2:348-1196(+)